MVKRINESNGDFDKGFLKYYDEMDLDEISEELGSDWEDDQAIFDELENNAYGTAISGLLAKPEYDDALWDNGIGCLTIMDNGTVGYNYGSNPMYFNSVSLDEVEECLRYHGLINDDYEECIKSTRKLFVNESATNELKEFYKYYKPVELPEFFRELGISPSQGKQEIRSIQQDGYGKVVKGLIAKPKYSDALDSEDLSYLYVMKDGSVCYGHLDYADINRIKEILYNAELITDYVDTTPLDPFDLKLREVKKLDKQLHKYVGKEVNHLINELENRGYTLWKEKTRRNEDYMILTYVDSENKFYVEIMYDINNIRPSYESPAVSSILVWITPSYL